jgi:hypothetical protein
VSSSLFHICLIYCTLFHFGVYSVVSVSSHVLYLWYLEISWVHFVHSS